MRKELAERASQLAGILELPDAYRRKFSLYNTPPTFSIYLMMLVSRWLLKQDWKRHAAATGKGGDDDTPIDAAEFTAAPPRRNAGRT